MTDQCWFLKNVNLLSKPKIRLQDFFSCFNFHSLLLYNNLSDLHSNQTAVTSFSSLLTPTSDWAFLEGSNFFALFYIT